jgi:hypothetical protein
MYIWCGLRWERVEVIWASTCGWIYSYRVYQNNGFVCLIFDFLSNTLPNDFYTPIEGLKYIWIIILFQIYSVVKQLLSKGILFDVLAINYQLLAM